MASLHFQTAAAAHRAMPPSMLAGAGRSHRLPQLLGRLLGRFDQVEVSEAIEIPAPLWPSLPVPADPPQPPAELACEADPLEDELGDTFGWHDSSLALQEGLDVAECLPTDLPADLPLGEWLQACLAC